MKDLSARQQRIFEFIRDFIDRHDYPPSIRQIQEACDISSTSVVDYNLRILEGKGFIRRDREVSRAISNPRRHSPRTNVPAPIIGMIAAGQPIPSLLPIHGGLTTRHYRRVPEMVGNREISTRCASGHLHDRRARE
jgi:repressor LexA